MKKTETFDFSGMAEPSKKPPRLLERHPLPPFFPHGARVLFLGSFPPPKNRWCMNFFYPNLQNDFWRILGLVFFKERDHFLTRQGDSQKPVFDQKKIESFLKIREIAIFDSAIEVIREKGNASDAFLTIVTPLDLRSVLTQHLTECQTLITTGEKATEALLGILAREGVSVSGPAVGSCVSFSFAGRKMTLCRLPSSSRAYPMAITKKAEIYEQILKKVLPAGSQAVGESETLPESRKS